MNRQTARAARVTVSLFLLLAGFAGWAESQTLFPQPPPGSVYRDFSRVMYGNEPRVTTPEAAANYPDRVGSDINLPNPWIDINGVVTANAVRAELIITMWSGHIGTYPKWFCVNYDTDTKFYIPEVLNTPTDPQCYGAFYNVVVDIPLNRLSSSMAFQGDAGTQTCWAFGWPQWLWYGLILRVYYDPGSVAHPNGVITSPGTGSSFNDSPTISVSTAGGGVSSDRVDVIAYYDSYDVDGDGVSQAYQLDYHSVTWNYEMEINNHVGTATGSGPTYQIPWSTTWLPNQAAGSVKLMARVRGTNGVWYVAPEVTGLTFNRQDGTVKVFQPKNTPEHFWARDGQWVGNQADVTTLSDVTQAFLLVRTWNGYDGRHNDPSPSLPITAVNGNNLGVRYGRDHSYSFDMLSLSTGWLKTGTNDIQFWADSKNDHGVEVMWPGPGFLVKYGGGSPPPEVPPSISGHPADQTVAEGQTATFTVSAAGTAPLSFQWQKNRTDIAGATGTSYTTPATTAADNNAKYRCVVTNPYGTATSNEATLTVGSASLPVISTHPADQTVGVGQSATFSVVASGPGTLTYQWQKNTVDVPGATGSSYSTPGATLADNNALYRCVVTNGAGSVTSNAARLTVSGGGSTLEVTQNPLDQTVGVGQTATFTVAATGPAAITYQWQKNGADIADATGASYTTPATALTDSGALYRCVVSSSGSSVTSGAALLRVTTGSVSILSNWAFDNGTSSWTFFTNGAGGFTVVNGGVHSPTAGRLAITAEGSNVQLLQAPLTLEAGAKYVLSFKAYCSTGHDFSVSLQKHGSPYTPYGLTSQVVDLTTAWKDFAVQFTAGGFTGVATDGRLMFWIAPYDAGGDEYYIDAVVLAKVSSVAPPAITAHPLNKSVNRNQTATFTVEVSGTPPFSYQWRKSGLDIPDANGPSYTTPPAVAGDDGASYLCVVSNPVGNVTSNPATLNVSLTGVRDLAGIPAEFVLEQSYPNPFNPSTDIRYGVPREGHVVLEVYNIVGEQVATLVNQTLPAGYYTARFDAQNLPSGIYLYRLKGEGSSLVKKMILTR
jgi:hypothetical protein